MGSRHSIIKNRWFSIRGGEFQPAYGCRFQRPRRTLDCPEYSLSYTVRSMQIDIVTIFPDFFAGPLDYGIVRRAREAQLIETHVHDLRVFTHDRHRTVDDRPFGGGEGMVMKPEP